jgi:hypothetical protein
MRAGGNEHEERGGAGLETKQRKVREVRRVDQVEESKQES